MTATRRQAVLTLARSLWEYDSAEGTTPEWREMAWEDMGGSEPSEERVEYELRADHLIETGAAPIEAETEARALEELAGWEALGQKDGIAHPGYVAEWLEALAERVRAEGSLTAALR